jgi:hypothetical protein
MDNDTTKNPETNIEEFSIMELDERLEFVAWTDTNCNCTGKGTTT